MLTVSDIQNLPGVPSTGPGVRKWLKANSVPVRLYGKRFKFSISDLPTQVKHEYWFRNLSTISVASGDYDDLMHAEFALATPSRRDRAERKAAIALTLITLREQGVKEADRLAIVRKRFGSEGTSTPSLKRLLKAVKGVAPINFAPALLDKYTLPKKRAEMSEDAWRFFMTLIRDAAPEWPLKSAWRDTRDAGCVMGCSFIFHILPAVG